MPKKVPNSSRLDYYSREMKRRDYKAKRNLDLSRKKRSPRLAAHFASKDFAERGDKTQDNVNPGEGNT